MNDHNLEYKCKESGATWKGKTLIANELYSVINPETEIAEKISKHHLKKRFICSRNNRYKNKPQYAYAGVLRGQRAKVINEDYLEGAG